MQQFAFALETQRSTKSGEVLRAGRMTTPHGVVNTPVFMPVGTAASVKSLDSRDIASTHAQIILANTYHLYLRPGTETLEAMGGVHEFMHWNGPMLTDSGGFQVFSLGLQQEQEKQSTKTNATARAVISDDGVGFTSHLDGSKHFFTPQKSIEIQQSIGADIIMAFDECQPDDAQYDYTQASLEKTHRWASESYAQWERKKRMSAYGTYQALFGIIQGGMHRDLRELSACYITGKTSDLAFDGIAVGGETIGYNMAGTVKVMSWIEQLLPTSKPRYAMGLGRDPQNLLDAIASGFDLFDCVGPSRLARNGALYSGSIVPKGEWLSFESPFTNGRLPIGNARFAQDSQVIDAHCDCYTCQEGYSRAYLHHLYRTKELSYYRLATMHNIRFMLRITEQARNFITAHDTNNLS